MSHSGACVNIRLFLTLGHRSGQSVAWAGCGSRSAGAHGFLGS